MKKNIFLFLIFLLVSLNGQVSFSEEDIFDEGMTEEEWAIIESWEFLEDLDFLKEDLEVIEELGEENEK